MLVRSGFQPTKVMFLMPGLDVFERKARRQAIAGMMRVFFGMLAWFLGGIWGSTLVMIAEADRDSQEQCRGPMTT